jgi:hypothetical protein
VPALKTVLLYHLAFVGDRSLVTHCNTPDIIIPNPFVQLNAVNTESVVVVPVPRWTHPNDRAPQLSQVLNPGDVAGVPPDLTKPARLSKVHVSVTFRWRIERGEVIEQRRGVVIELFQYGNRFAQLLHVTLPFAMNVDYQIPSRSRDNETISLDTLR